MDREAFAKRLPEHPPMELRKWAADQKGELGDKAYTVYRCERAYGEPIFPSETSRRTFCSSCDIPQQAPRLCGADRGFGDSKTGGGLLSDPPHVW